jgi:lipopolysaccharide transport system ATP-binding protein
MSVPFERSADIRLLNVSKRYRLRGGPPGAPQAWPRLHFRQRRRDFWALRDVSFDVLESETLGIIGHNGAGKSTLLKLLSAITAPSEGEIRIRGRLAALIELGSGFHPELTGRENLYLSGTLLGMRRREIASKLDQIVAFAGVGEFLDVPVKWYSSGMYVRLGFSIAAHLDPDILLVDEVLAVGDAEFQARCYTRIRELQAAGLTIVFISHDLSAVERLCSRVVLLDHGRVIRIGEPGAVTGTYQRLVEGSPVEEEMLAPAPVKPAEITGLSVCHRGGGDALLVSTGEPIEVHARCRSRAGAAAELNLYFYGFNDGALHCRCTAEPDGAGCLPPGASTVIFSMPALALKPGLYTLGLTMTEPGAARPFDWRYARTTLHVRSARPVDGRFYMPYTTRLLVGDAGGTPAHAGGVMIPGDDA